MSSSDTDVVEVKAANSLLPNLTISIEKDEETEEPQVEFAEDETNGVQKDRSDTTSRNANSMKISLEATSFPHTKIYENKALKEMGLAPAEALTQREKRAKRFQSPLNRTEADEEYQKVNEDAANSMLEKIKQLNETSEHEIVRLDAVFLRGVNEMSTEDIFRFFSNFLPTHIEWINDTSCNVSWKDDTSAVNAYLSMTRSENAKPKEKIAKTDSAHLPEADDSLDLMDSDTEEQMETEETDGQPKATQKNTTEPQEMVEKKAEQERNDSEAGRLNELRRCEKPFVKDGRKHLLKMRLATDSDKKIVGGASKSTYYKKYGNPNYGNVKGLLTRSFMKRFHHRKAKQELENLNIRPEYGDPDKTPEQDVQTSFKRKTMYSEESWIKSKKRKEEKEEDGSSHEEDGEISSSDEDEQEKEDRDLMNTSAKDLSDAVPVRSRHRNREDGGGTMMADRIAEKIRNARRQNAEGEARVSERKKQNVWSRLGRRSAMTFTVKNDDDQRQRRKHTREPDKRVLEKLPASLRDRLGTKDNDRDDRHVHERSRSSRRYEDRRKIGRRRSRSESPLKEVKKERELPRYSPPPWDGGEEDMDEDSDEFAL